MNMFSKNLFWDVDETELDVHKNRRFIIERVLTRGRMSDWWVLIQLYSYEIIKQEVVQIRYLDKVTLTFAVLFLIFLKLNLDVTISHSPSSNSGNI